MHYTHIVALPGDIDPNKLESHLEEAMALFDENREVELHRDTSVYARTYDVQLAAAKASSSFSSWGVGLTDAEIVKQWDGNTEFDTDGWPLTTSNPDGHWDYWRIGGRWQGEWVLKPGAEAGPLQADGDKWDAPPPPDHDRPTTDSGRKNAIEPESIRATYSWLDLDGVWTTKWIGPSAEEANSHDYSNTSHWEVDEKLHDAAFFTFLANLPANTWLVHIDYHN